MRRDRPTAFHRHPLKIAGTLWLALAAMLASAQGYPNRPVRMIVGQPAGGNADFTARLYAQRLGERFGVQFVVDNRGGAGGVIATELTARSQPDGYTLFLGHTALGTNPALIKNLPFDTRRDLAPISLLIAGPNIVVVGAGHSLRSIGDIIKEARARPGKLNYASSGVATATHVSGELFKYMTKVDMQHVAYKGAPASMVAVSTGEADVSFAGMAGALPLIRGGRLRALAVTGEKRWPTLPDIPTVSESGVPGYEAKAWYALFAPARLPVNLVSLLHGEVAAISKTDDLRSRVMAEGLEPLGTTPRELDEFLAREIAKWMSVAKAAGLTAN
jgi:tripartite-type tricarboxylate transporter receptor subunit TctC